MGKTSQLNRSDKQLQSRSKIIKTTKTDKTDKKNVGNKSNKNSINDSNNRNNSNDESNHEVSHNNDVVIKKNPESNIIKFRRNKESTTRIYLNMEKLQ